MVTSQAEHCNQSPPSPTGETESSASRPNRPTGGGPPAKRTKFTIREDKLGKLVLQSINRYLSSSSWIQFARESRNREHIRTTVNTIPHPAAELLGRYQREGVPVEVELPPDSLQLRQERVSRGPHTSAKEAIDFVRDEMADFAIKGYWVILPYEVVKDLPNLHLSPLGSVPQRGRRPRLIVDLSFFGVNDATRKQAPQEAMQFGQALQRILQKLRHANSKFGPIYLNKIDISDGFYRVMLQPEAAPQLSVMLPTYPEEPPLVAIPLSLPMGWVESPPYFCAVTETIADLTNSRLHWEYAPPHRLERISETPTEPTETIPMTATSLRLPSPRPVPAHRDSNRVTNRPLNHTDVYVDDFCSLIQGSKRRRRIAKRILFHAIDEVLTPLEPNHKELHKEPISEKKLKQGDGHWETRKIILGWLLDTTNRTISLPAHRQQRLKAIFEELKGAKRVGVRQWQKYLGELRSMILAVPGGRGLFSMLQHGLSYSERNRVRIDKHMRAHLHDFALLTHDLHSRPTHVAELVPEDPIAIGCHDASGMGMGGVWFAHGKRPILWRQPFPKTIQNDLVSWENPSGSISNSDLELAGGIAHADVLAQAGDIRHRTIALLGDNIATTSWLQKGSHTTKGPSAYLLRVASFHQRHHRYCFSADYIPGPANVMADDASRLWHLSDDELLSHFNAMYPQTAPWQMLHLRSPMNSALITSLQRKPAELAPILNELPATTVLGKFGKPFAPTWADHHSWKTWTTQSRCSKSSPNATGTVGTPKTVNPYAIGQWKKPYAALARRWPAWGPPTPGCAATSTNFASANSSMVTVA